MQKHFEEQLWNNEIPITHIKENGPKHLSRADSIQLWKLLKK
jgi:hypothetical protein